MAYNFLTDKENGMGYIPFSETEDAIVLSETHGSSNQICSQTLEDGREYRDHVVNEPDSLSVEIHVPNVSSKTLYPISYVYKTLKELCRGRRLLKVTTFLEEYDNYVIQDVSTPISSPYKGMSTVTVKFAPLLLLDSGVTYIERSAAIGKFEDPGQVYIGDEEIPIEPQKRVKMSVLRDLLMGLLKFMAEMALQKLMDSAISLVSLLGVAKAVCNFNSFGRALGIDGKKDDPDVSLKSNIATFNTTVESSMFSTSLAFDSGKGCYCASLYDVNGNPVASNIALLPGTNCVKGLNIAIPSSDNKEHSMLHGLFVTVPFRNGEWQWDAASRQDAFTPDDRTGIPPCTLLVIGDGEIYAEYMELVSDMPHEFAYDFDRLGYTVLMQQEQ